MEVNLANLNFQELSELEIQEIEGGSITLFTIACCSIAFATGVGTALMIL